MLIKLNRRPRPPSRDDALHMTKEEWEALFLDWRNELRDLHAEYGKADYAWPSPWLEAAVSELENAIDSEDTL